MDGRFRAIRNFRKPHGMIRAWMCKDKGVIRSLYFPPFPLPGVLPPLALLPASAAPAPRCAPSGMHAPAGHRAGFREGGEEKPAVVVMENRFTPVASRHHVVIGTGKFKTYAPHPPRRLQPRARRRGRARPHLGSSAISSSCGRAMTCAAMTLPSDPTACLPASMAAETAATSPLTMTVT